jgi:Tfp pilus assembly protein PilW
MRNLSLQRGYSLLELVIYLALFTLLSIVLIKSLVTVMRTYATAQSYRALQNNGELVLERITREVREADSFSGGTYGINPGTLGLSANGQITTFSVVNGAVQINDNGTTGILTTSEVTVTSLIFKQITTTTTKGVKVELTLTTASGYSNSISLYTTIMMRGQ